MAGLSEIYSFEDYREYIESRLSAAPFGRGARLKLADFLGCQPSFVSQVLSGRNELSLDHAHKVNVFFNHSNEESQYLVYMVLLSKAGTFDLQKFLRDQMRDMREQQMQVHKIVEKRELHRDDLLYYYSNWLCISAHMLVTIEKYQDPKALQTKLGASDKEFADTINFLSRTGLIEVRGGLIEVGDMHVHLKKTSPYAQSASILTRLKVLEKLRLSDQKAVNFTSNFTISRKSYEILRKKILEFVVELDEQIQAEDPDGFYTLVLDLIEH